MIITNHVLAGALIGLHSRSAPVAATVGLASHLAMDAVPHWGVDNDEAYLRVARVDGLTGLLVSATAIITAPAARRWQVAAGIFGACLPDTDQVSVHFLGTHVHPAWFNDLHYTIQREHEWFGQELLLAAGLATAVALATRRARRHSATLVGGA